MNRPTTEGAGMVKRLAVLFPSGQLDRCPTLKSLALALAEQGYRVDVYTVESESCAKPAFDHPAIRVYFLWWKQRRFYEPVGLVTLAFAFWVLRELSRRDYGCVIGAGIRGLLVGALVSLVHRVPVIYHCLELYISSEHPGILFGVFKALERWSNSRCEFTIIQDSERAGILCRENGVPMDRILLLPNSPPGRASRKKSDYLQKRLGIPENRKVILCAGTIFARWAMAKELVEAAQEWPDDWVLVLHSSAAPERPEFVASLEAANTKGRAVLSLRPVPYEELESLVSSADVGLAIYNNTSENMYQIGLSSGKLAQYLKSGLPVVVSDFPALRRIVEQYRCGAVVAHPGQIRDALLAIFADYQSYCRGSIESFDRLFALHRYEGVLLERLARIVQERQQRRCRH